MSPDALRARYARIREEVGPAVTVVAATKYVSLADMAVLVEAGVEVVGENRAQDLEAKSAAHPELTWDFIGHLQSRKVKQVLPYVRWIHSVASDSALEQLARQAAPGTEVLVEVNVSGEAAKAGIAPEALGDFLARCPVRVAGLMTMPPFAQDPEASRPAFARLRELAAEASKPAPTDCGLNVFTCIADSDAEALAIFEPTMGSRFEGDALVSQNLVGSVDTVLRRLREFQAVGVNLVEMKPIYRGVPALIAMMELIAREVMPAVGAERPSVRA